MGNAQRAGGRAQALQSTICMVPISFSVLAFGFQLALLCDFALRWWRPEQEKRWAKSIYALFGLPALPVGAALVLEGADPRFFVGPVLLLVWAAFGFVVDGVKQIPWRKPPRWSVFAPYVSLYTLAIFSFWMPLLDVEPAQGLAFGVVFAVHTILNIGSHVRTAEVSHL